jgi:ribonuclease P protein component
MDVSSLQDVVQKEENASPYPVKRIDLRQADELLQNGRRSTMRGITLYTKPTEFMEVGFLIRKSAGSAVQRNKTRRLFWGLVNNHPEFFDKETTYLFLFHHRFLSTGSLKMVLEELFKRNLEIAE